MQKVLKRCSNWAHEQQAAVDITSYDICASIRIYFTEKKNALNYTSGVC